MFPTCVARALLNDYDSYFSVVEYSDVFLFKNHPAEEGYANRDSSVCRCDVSFVSPYS